MIKKYSLYVMILLYIVAGINHFINPEFYLKIMPSYIPFHLFMVYLSGVFEIVFALLLIPQQTRRMGAWLIILLLIAVFPANIQMAIDWHNEDNPNFWISIVRLPLQLVLIWWAWIFTKKEG